VGSATSLALVLIHFSCGLTGGRVGSRRTPSLAARRALHQDCDALVLVLWRVGALERAVGRHDQSL